MKWNNNLNKKYTLISLYVIVTAVIIYILSLVAKNAPILLSEIAVYVSWLMKVMKPIVLGFVLAYLFDPLINFFETRYSKIRIRKKPLKSTRTMAVLTTVLLFFLFIIGLISLLVFSVTNQLRLASLDDMIILADTYLKYFDDFYKSITSRLNELNIQSPEISDYIRTGSNYILNLLKNMANNTVSSVTNISSYFTTFLFALIIGIYFMIDGSMIKEYIRKVGKALISDRGNERIRSFLHDANVVFSGYIRGTLADALIMAVVISLALSIIGVKFGLIIGIISGIGNLIPYCGPFIAYGGTIIVCLINGQYKELLIAFIALFIIQTVDGNIIAPKLLSNSIEIHPVLVIIFLIFGNAIGGLLGMLLAVPVGALIKVIFVRFIDNKLIKKEAKNHE